MATDEVPQQSVVFPPSPVVTLLHGGFSKCCSETILPPVARGETRFGSFIDTGFTWNHQYFYLRQSFYDCMSPLHRPRVLTYITWSGLRCLPCSSCSALSKRRETSIQRRNVGTTRVSDKRGHNVFSSIKIKSRPGVVTLRCKRFFK